MISVEEARKLIAAQAMPLLEEEQTLSELLNRTLAEDVIAPIDHPLFDQSAMDGVALRASDVGTNEPLAVIGKIQAGDHNEYNIGEGEAALIYTGAPIPNGADAIAMREIVEVKDDKVSIASGNAIRNGLHIRYKGEQVKTGAVAIPKDTVLNPASVGFIASLGINVVKVIQKPKVGIVVTGNEFVDPGSELKLGEIYESNGMMLQSALRKYGVDSTYKRCEDDEALLEKVFGEAAENNNVLLTTGGVSVGDYDFTRSTLEKLGFEVVFHKVAQKPGKPLLFMKKGDKVAFGLPGNPRAAMISFMEYVLPYLMRLEGSNKLPYQVLKLPMKNDHRKNDDGKTYYVTGKIVEGSIEIMKGQNSHMLQSLSESDAIIVLPSDTFEYKAGDLVEVHLF
jgi:molybdopterin molybdotransferase